MALKLVEFEDGTFGVRRGWWSFHEFLDLQNPIFWWQQGGRFFRDCTGTRAEAESRLAEMKIREIDIAHKRPAIGYKIVGQ